MYRLTQGQTAQAGARSAAAPVPFRPAARATRLDARRETQLAEDPFDVDPRGAGRDHEALGDLSVASGAR
jgi:hypothetical protein